MPFFADTNLCDTASRDPALCAKFMAAKKHFELEGHKYVVCPLVLAELVAGLATPEPSYFKSDLRRFVFLAGEGTPVFLDFPGAFVLRTVLDCKSPVAKLNKGDFEQWLNVTLGASTRDDLVQGRVEMYRSERVAFGLNPEVIAKQQKSGRNIHIEAWEKRVAENVPCPSKDVWAAALLIGQGIIYQASDLEKIGAALDAAYEYDSFLFRVAPKYNFHADRNAGDWIDSQMLFYLADPQMHIVTCDTRLRERISKSPQAIRVHVIDEFRD